ncbi:hypothetical protein TNCV_2634761 [Trichonephila clavipes]|nr:hypothetical protein TNCV_2634761 [Trichonephila clavipes]
MGIISEGDIFKYPQRKTSGTDKFEERGGQSPLEMPRSSKITLKLLHCPVICDTLRRLATTKRTVRHCLEWI